MKRNGILTASEYLPIRYLLVTKGKRITLNIVEKRGKYHHPQVIDLCTRVCRKKGSGHAEGAWGSTLAGRTPSWVTACHGWCPRDLRTPPSPRALTELCVGPACRSLSCRLRPYRGQAPVISETLAPDAMPAYSTASECWPGSKDTHPSVCCHQDSSRGQMAAVLVKQACVSTSGPLRKP